MLLQLRRRRRIRPYHPHPKGSALLAGGCEREPRCNSHDVAEARPREGAGCGSSSSSRSCSCACDEDTTADSRTRSSAVTKGQCAVAYAAPTTLKLTATTRRRRVRRRRSPIPTRQFGGAASSWRSRTRRRRTLPLLPLLLLLLLVLVRQTASFAFVPSCNDSTLQSMSRLLLSAAPRRNDDRSPKCCDRTTATTITMLLPPRGHCIPSRKPSPFHGTLRRRQLRCGATNNEGDEPQGDTRASATADREGGGGGSDGSSGNHDRDGALSNGAAASQLDVPPDELQRRAQLLREEAGAMRSNMELAKQQQLQKETDKADRWLEEVLVHHRINADTEILNTVEQAQAKLVQGRYSPDQVDHMFERLCQLSRVSGRDCLDRNARLQLLVEATGKVDELEPEVNPNKRWKGSRVEHELHKKLFAKEWGIDLDEKRRKGGSKDEHDERYWRTRRKRR